MIPRNVARAALGCVLAVLAMGQRKPEVNGWNPPAYDLASITPATARPEARREIDRILDILRGAPPLTAPQFPIYVNVEGGGPAGNATAPATYDLRASFYRPGMVGKVMDDQVRVVANDPAFLWDTEQAQSAHAFGERELRAEPRFDRAWHGYPMNERGFIIVARPGRGLFRPVSVKDYSALLTAQLAAKARDGDAVYAEMLQRVRRKFAALSAAALAAPAYACQDDIDEDTFLCASGSTGGRRLVEFDPAYWDRAEPRTAIQLLVLYRYNPEFRTGPVGTALTAAWETLDWTRWRQLLELR